MTSNKKNFETARTRKFREATLVPEDERTIGHIEEFGCSVVSVARTSYGLKWSHTVGVFDTCGKPELLTVGLLPETAHSALNGAAKLLRAGVDLTTVHKGTEPVTYVSHDADDGSWQFLGQSMADGGGPVLSCFHHPIDRDPSLTELADLPVGWYAQRSKVGGPWVRKKHELRDESE